MQRHLCKEYGGGGCGKLFNSGELEQFYEGGSG